MASFLKKNFPFHTAATQPEKPGAKHNILLCKECGAAYWYKTWHHSLEDYPSEDINRNIKMSTCPACKMKAEGRYSGELILENIPAGQYEEVKNLISNFGKLAFDNDPMARIITLDELARGMIRTLTTQNQMISQLAKKIQRTYKGKANLIHSKLDKIIRIRVVFP